MEFEERIKDRIKAVPHGRVATYAQIAALAGNPRGARQVARVLHSCSGPAALPWHRIINSRGWISLKRGRGFEEQKRLLVGEGVKVGRGGRIDLDAYRWQTGSVPSRAAREFLTRLESTPDKHR
jgi:methylated-DNA-protein-cysteine methyltransferase-like protein